ncbi:DUF4160 domain-containing protein [Desulfonatronum thioautotrophicum]|uniref:DUF4160 domain-containing protein n=1 Tax=Desulfonatronum thioautotrophicum TaxID=617001 RepID=UPI000A07124D|nr:DUF4160 domain-containing protein [Desulfonatronum thioautotrophicum]
MEHANPPPSSVEVWKNEEKGSDVNLATHAKYGDYKATVSILDLCILEGNLPRRATQLVLDWTELNQAELMQNWERCKAKKHPLPIKPLT